jgi:3-oxoacyl-[acyl-carrier-protein] synthase II
MNNRVVITGMSGVSAFGNNADDIFDKLKLYKNAVIKMEDWMQYEGLHTKLAAPVLDITYPENFHRTKTRSMGPVSKMATLASQNALINANLIGHDVLISGNTGVSYGSSTGSTQPVVPFTNMLRDKVVKGITATSYVKMMPHTCPVNIALFFGLKGRIIPTSTACTSGSQGVGYGYEAIKFGLQTVMIGGGAEELCPSEAAVFDTLYATSTMNDTPEKTPAPFDQDRDGLVLGEGAGTLILEELDHAKARGAKIYAEILGFATNCDAQHITRPCADDMERVMRLALKNAGVDASEVGYVNAHGTSTDKGDVAESQATFNVFGSNTPISSLKSYFGHTLGACGAMETWLSIEMMLRNWFAPTINLNKVDERCPNLDYIMHEGREMNIDTIVCNNFAFGGINTSLVIRKYQG